MGRELPSPIVIMKLFFCYSKRLKNALVSNGFECMGTGFNIHTHSRFWVFLGTKELNDYKEFKYQLERDRF